MDLHQCRAGSFQRSEGRNSQILHGYPQKLGSYPQVGVYKVLDERCLWWRNF